MAQPYQDLQGNWFIAGRPMNELDIAMMQEKAKQVIPSAPVAPQDPAQAPIKMAPKKKVAPVDPIQEAVRAAEEQKRFGLNPLGVAFGKLFGGK